MENMDNVENMEMLLGTNTQVSSHFAIVFVFILEEQTEIDERLTLESSSDGATEDGGHTGTTMGPGVGSQDPLRRCNQRKKSDMVLLGCASILAAVGLGSDLLQLGRMQVH